MEVEDGSEEMEVLLVNKKLLNVLHTNISDFNFYIRLPELRSSNL